MQALRLTVAAIEAALARAGLSQVFAFCPLNNQVPPAHRV